MTQSDKLEQLTEEIKELIKTLNKPRRDFQGWITILTSFLASVVLAGLTLYYSNKESARSADERERNFAYNKIRDSLEAKIRTDNLRVAELEALKDFVPLLASKDSSTRSIAIQLLKASADINDGTRGGSDQPKRNDQNSPAGHTTPGDESIRNRFYLTLATAQSMSQPIDKRQQALAEAQTLMGSKKISEADKRKGLTIVSEIATAPSTPAPVKQSAEAVIANLREISLEQVPALLASESVTRKIESIILHHAGYPITTSNFRGASTIFSIAKFQTSSLNWNRVSWHYAISPSGSIWLGMPLNERAIHAREQNKTSVSILLIIDGDKELPTATQKATTSALLKLLFVKLELTKTSLKPHRYFSDIKSCPGTLVTDEYISGLVR